MGQSNKLKYYLVHCCGFTNKEAAGAISSGALVLNGKPITENLVIGPTDEILYNNTIIKQPAQFVYIKFYKPKGFESTLNRSIEANIAGLLPETKGLSIAGRLDKNSEGLLLLSNDGKWVQQICDPESHKEKTYIVGLEKKITDEFLEQFANGVDIGFYVTRKCQCEKIDDFTIKVILTEGKNKQIRRMSKSLKNKVLNLKRIKIDAFELGNLEPGEYELTKI